MGKILCAIGIHSWGYRDQWFRVCHQCSRGQTRTKVAGSKTPWKFMIGEF